MQVELDEGSFTVDAALLGELLGVAAADVPRLMRDGEITSVCERGVGADLGRYRLSFFHRGRRARLGIDGAGRVLTRSVVDFGEAPLPRGLRGGG